jgi:hypothetical protein
MISEEIVEATRQEVGGFSDSAARAYMAKLGRRQQDLLVFVMTMTEQMSMQAHETAIYTFVVLCRMFERSAVKPLPRAKHRRIAAVYEKSSEELERLTVADERFLERHALVTTGSEPHAMRYVVEVLLEPDDPEDQLSDDEVGELFLCLKTVVDVLHEVSAQA